MKIFENRLCSQHLQCSEGNVVQRRHGKSGRAARRQPVLACYADPSFFFEVRKWRKDGNSKLRTPVYYVEGGTTSPFCPTFIYLRKRALTFTYFYIYG